MPTIGIDFKMKTIAINGKRVKVQVVREIFIYFIVIICGSGIQLARNDLEL